MMLSCLLGVAWCEYEDGEAMVLPLGVIAIEEEAPFYTVENTVTRNRVNHTALQK